MEADEVKARGRQCSRLLSAWPNARPMSVDLTLIEYVNATRGVPLPMLSGMIDAVIQAAGEFMPPAGAIMERVVRSKITARGMAYNANVSGEQRAKEAQERLLAEARKDAAAVEPVLLEELQQAVGIAAGGGRPMLAAGRTVKP